MKLKIIHLYPESMSLYGEYANITVLKRHLEYAGTEVEVSHHTFEDRKISGHADMIYMGAGTERMQKAVLESLSGEEIGNAAAEGSLVFFTGNAMETLGASVTDAEGRLWKGLGIADFVTVEGEKRINGDVIACSELLGEPAVGFMNKCSVTKGVKKPLFNRLLMGFGNEEELGAEGFRDENIIATHLTGPVLVKNPAFLKLITEALLKNKGIKDAPAYKELPHERKSYEVTLSELRKQIE